MVTSVCSQVCVYREMQRRREGGGCLSYVSSKGDGESHGLDELCDLRSRLPAMEFLWEGKRKGKLDPLVYNYLFK